jgi:hypothetical protein
MPGATPFTLLSPAGSKFDAFMGTTFSPWRFWVGVIFLGKWQFSMNLPAQRMLLLFLSAVTQRLCSALHSNPLQRPPVAPPDVATDGAAATPDQCPLSTTHQPPAVKLVCTLVSLAESYGQPTEKGTEIFNIPYKDLADITDISVEDTAKIMEKLDSKGWIKIDQASQTLYLINIKQLTHLAQRS